MPIGSSDVPRPTRAEVDLGALRFNIDQIRKKIGSQTKVMAVVKANAYGHGIVEVAKAAVGFGVDSLGVAYPEEGLLLRQNGIVAPVVVLAGTVPDQAGACVDCDLELAVPSVDIARCVDDAAQRRKRKAKVHLKIDTGMERIGVHAEDASRFAKDVAALGHVEIVGIFTHFATADEADKMFALRQLERFQKAVDGTKAMGIEIPLRHIANSGAILDMPETCLDMVRPGLILYGIYPSKETSESLPLKPVMALRSRVVFVKEVPPNTSISYGREYITSRATRIATVPIGYADGYSRLLTNKSEVLIHGRRYRIVGVICMDQFMVDIGESADITVGDDVTLIGRDGTECITAWELADRMNTIPYEILCAVSARVPRVYTNA